LVPFPFPRLSPSVAPRYHYDEIHRITEIHDTSSLVATYTYENDNEGRCPSQKDGNGATNVCDKLCRIIAVIDALGETTHFDYDPVDSLRLKLLSTMR
jgi:hypothetical protein